MADKNTAERKRIAAMLQASGHRVKAVDNGEQALDALEHQRYDIALINLDLPIMSAIQVIKLHRFTTPHAQWISFVVMTDQTTPTTLRTCRELQVRACLFKPVPSETLIRIIDTAPVISLPTPLTLEQLPHAPPPTGLETQFLNAVLLDTQILEGLEHLDNDHDFVPDLITIFDRDSTTLLQRMEELMEYRDAKHFVELSNVLMDNAGQLGAFALYETCLGLQRMNPDELNATLPAKLERLRDLVDRTSLAFKRYLRERSDRQSDHN
jgi:two-component system sensor histidine kinase RpfC